MYIYLASGDRRSSKGVSSDNMRVAEIVRVILPSEDFRDAHLYRHVQKRDYKSARKEKSSRELPE